MSMRGAPSLAGKKERSPSCGVSEIYGPDGLRPGEGRFTARLRKRGLPVVSETSST